MKHMKNNRWTVDSIKEFAHSKSGQFLSKKYRGMREQHEWKCSNGHRWKTKAINVLSHNTWCPKCARNITEERCRFVLEQLTGEEWINTRSILAGLELDGYSQKLHAAFEYNGEQHYHDNHIFRKTSYLEQQERDQQKLHLCREKCIKMIIISYKKKNNLEEHIKSELSILGIPINQNKVNWKQFNYCKSLVQKLHRVAQHRKGKCLSTKYAGALSFYKWQCDRRHIWTARIDRVKRIWCPYCAKVSYRNQYFKKRLDVYRLQKSPYVDWGDFRFIVEGDRERLFVSIHCPSCKVKRYRRADRVYRNMRFYEYHPLCHACSCKSIKKKNKEN